jgi:hypothetical protein
MDIRKKNLLLAIVIGLFALGLYLVSLFLALKSSSPP